MSMTNILSRLFQDGTGNKLRQEILPPIPSDLLPSIPINLLPQKELDAKAAHAAMPASGTYIDISVPSSPTTYTAPSDGWVFFRRSVTGKGTISLINKNSTIESLLQVSETNGMGTFVPVNKDDIVEFSYQGTYFGSGLVARFIYVNGNAPE